MGNTVVLKPPQYGALAVRAAAGGVPRCVPAGRDQHDLRAGRSRGAAHARVGQGQRAGAHRLEPGRRPPEEAASQVAPTARGPRPRRQERRHRAARRRPRARGQGMPARRAVLQRPALHGAQDADRPPVDRRRLPAALQRGDRQAQGRHAVGDRRADHAAARAAPDGLHDRRDRGRKGQGRARRQRRRRQRSAPRCSIRPSSTRCARA